jgi:hypothetical protein
VCGVSFVEDCCDNPAVAGLFFAKVTYLDDSCIDALPTVQAVVYRSGACVREANGRFARYWLSTPSCLPGAAVYRTDHLLSDCSDHPIRYYTAAIGSCVQAPELGSSAAFSFSCACQNNFIVAPSAEPPPLAPPATTPPAPLLPRDRASALVSLFPSPNEEVWAPELWAMPEKWRVVGGTLMRWSMQCQDDRFGLTVMAGPCADIPSTEAYFATLSSGTCAPGVQVQCPPPHGEPGSCELPPTWRVPNAG